MDDLQQLAALQEGSSTDLGRFVPGMSRLYLKEMKAVGTLDHIANL